MSNLQFALFFVALSIGYVLVHLRLAKFETYLKEVSVLQKLNERLQGVAAAMDRIKVERLEEGLDALHQDARELQEVAGRIERNTMAAEHAHEAGPVIVPGGPTVAERVCAAVEERLFQLGFQNPRILTDLHNLALEDEVEVQVECERQMMPYKGKVKAKNGSILDVDVHSVVTMFP